MATRVPKASAGPLTPERWMRVHEALQSALDRDPAARADFVEVLAREDAGLGGEVASLLRASTGPFDVLIDRFVDVPDEPVLPHAIGPWRPTRVLGRGGMGTVYLAERSDGSFEREVALKLLPIGTSADGRGRFLAERRILARLRHTNIAQLLDGGTAEDGRPYLVMEHVAGERITDFCDRRALPLVARLRLFLDVCAAVRYAHANLVVHRDIKPSNVLVVPAGDARGVPRVKLLDFGIAKLLDESASGEAPRTRTDVRVMTPELAAPEQLDGEAVTTATDVYQLGTLLYELVCGRRPFHSTRDDLMELHRRIRAVDPDAPSLAVTSEGARARSTTPARLHRALRGDIDRIALRALQKEPERRYPSAEALATDVRRHLDGLPIHARPDGFGYIAVKFVRRHRRVLSVASVVAVLLAAAGANAAVSATRAARERDRAERATAFLVDLFEGLEPAQLRGDAMPADTLLERGVTRVHAELAGQPLLQASLLEALGRVYKLRGRFAEAEPLLREALALRTGIGRAGDIDVARSRHELADLLGEMDRYAEAGPLLDQAAGVYRAAYGTDDARVAVVDIDRALARRAEGDLAAAQSLLDHAMRSLRADPAASRTDLATALLYAGKVRLERGDLAGARAPLEEALRIRRALFGEVHPMVANALDGLGEAMIAGGDPAAAEDHFRAALAIRREILPDGHSDIGVALLNLGIALHGQGREAEAGAALGEALHVLRGAFGDGNPLVATAVAYADSVGGVFEDSGGRIGLAQRPLRTPRKTGGR